MKLPLWDFLPPRGRKLVRWAGGLLLAYTLLGFLILPPIIRAVAVKQLSKQLGREVSLEKVKFNPFVLSATVRGLLIKDKDGQPFVSWDEVYVNFQLASLFGHPWVFKEVSVTAPFVRVQMNKDYSFNFSDLLTGASTNAPPKEPAKPLSLRIERLSIARAAASLKDLTERTPFQRVVGPVDVTLVNFWTDPSSKNPYAIVGTTDAGEKFAWNGSFYLDPLRSTGELSIENLALNKYAALYQDFVRFQIRDGTVDLRSTYDFELSASNRVAWVTNTSFRLHTLKVAESANGPSFVEVPEFAVTGVSADAGARRAEVESITTSGARLWLRRDQAARLNVVELAKPAEAAPNNPAGSVLLLLRTVTNAVALLLESTNTWTGTIHDVQFQDNAVSLEDLVNSRPVRLDLDNINFSARHISNLPGTNLSASLSLRWNTNGAIKTDVQASFSPLTVDVQLGLEKLELKALDPYLESKLDLFVLGSKLSLDGQVRVRTTNAGLPQVTFEGNARLDDFAAVDGVLGEDLLKWGSVRISGIHASATPASVKVREVAVDDAFVRVIIETNHTINLQAALRMTDTNAPASPSAQPPGKPARGKAAPPPGETLASSATNAPVAATLPEVSIASVVISNAQLRFTDRSVTPNVNMTIQEAGGTITGLSSETVGHAEVALHASVDKVGPVEITGLINPLNLNQTNEIKVVVKNVDLTPTSPYVGRFAGYRLAEGKLQLDLAYHLKGRKLKAENLVVLDRFTFGDKVNSPDATKLPVRLAIAILKDRGGKITLDVPIEGSLDDPQFRLHKVIVGAIVNLLTRIVTSPFAALSAVFGGKGEELNFQDFAAGSATLQAAGKEKLDALVKGLYERPGLQLEIAGSVEPEKDRKGLRHLALEQRLRMAKWLSLHRSARETIAPDHVTLTPEERQHWLVKLYEKAVSSGEISPPGETNQATTTEGPTPATNTIARLPGAESHPAGLERGGTALMERPKPKVVPLPLPAMPATKSERAALAADAMENALLQSIAIPESELQRLAADRAKAVRDYVAASGKVEPQRVFLSETQAEGVRSQGTRAYLQLR